MKSLVPALQAHLDGGATTLALCWRIERRDGVVLGFTEHDLDLEFDGVTHKAATGFSATEISQSLGLAVDNLEAAGALSSAAITETDLASGRYDDADVRIELVNWTDVGQRALIATGSLGDVTRTRDAFTAEIRSLAHRLQQRIGRAFQYYCDADLGDSRCAVAIAGPSYTGTGAVISLVSPRRTLVSGLGAFAAGWFAGGRLEFTSGNANGLAFEVRGHTVPSGVEIELWAEPAVTLGSGDTFTVTAGCDKSFTTCKAKFANGLNFRGFPHIPGNDHLQSYPNSGEARLDGGSLFE
ncbi:Gene Transfer Agent FAD/FMN-containing dehydrogenase [hydrothermal vent metagenome]|uniref:Gene Transfer Agent FAD/FMN-containing dehydrogenase n=1 Tax=hydrothermal vent metagenome TaxID=652676 RepID=A0A3B0TNA1_9ZZZZ